MRIPFNRINQLIPGQLPQYVKENYPTFIAFLQAYYTWLEQPGNILDGVANVLNDRDIDKTVDDFISYFKYEFLIDIPERILADKRKLAKHIKQFYTARGTQKSYKLLFQILYNEDVEFYLPKVDLLKTSDGKWSVDTIIRSTTNTNTFDY